MRKRLRKNTALDELIKLVEVQTDECVLWPYGVRANGYGGIRRNNKTEHTHSVACEYVHGPRPNGLQVRHLCGARLCVNPRHLKWGTRNENMADRDAHERTARGSKHGSSILTDEDVIKIRELLKSNRPSHIAKQYGVTRQAISSIRDGESWRCLNANTKAQKD